MADTDSPCSPHGWTLDTLEKHLTEKINSLDRFCTASFAQSKERVDMALAASDKAITKAEQTTEKRFEGVNEFRSALSDQSSLMLTRTEYQAQQQTINERVSMLTDAVTKIDSRMVGKHEALGGTGVMIVGTAVVISALISIASLLVSLLRVH